jgi:hypothetical protein
MTIIMESLRIEIIHPKARRLINSLADMNLIRIRKDKTPPGFKDLLISLRKHSDKVPSLDEITKEVEIERKARYEK